MTDKHTPGPWVRDRYGILRAPDGREVLTTGFALTLANSSKDSDAIANARLMAAAPELREALRDLRAAFMAHTQWSGEPPAEVLAADAAIAKATTP
jgi:hypothetical protein